MRERRFEERALNEDEMEVVFTHSESGRFIHALRVDSSRSGMRCTAVDGPPIKKGDYVQKVIPKRKSLRFQVRWIMDMTVEKASEFGVMLCENALPRGLR